MVLKCVLIVMQMVGDGGWFDGWVDGWVIFDRPPREVCQKITHPFTHLMVATLTSPTVASHLTPPCKNTRKGGGGGDGGHGVDVDVVLGGGCC